VPRSGGHGGGSRPRPRRLGAFLLRHGKVWRGGSNWSLKHEQWLNSLAFEDAALSSTFAHYRVSSMRTD
jgi:transposase